MDSPSGEHASEVETSLMLALDPDRVQMGRVSRPARHTGPAGTDAGLHEPMVILPEGGRPVYGDASAATAERGRALFDVMVDEIVQHLQESVQVDPQAAPGGHSRACWLYPQPRKTRPLAVRSLSLSWSEAVADFEVAVLPMGAASKEHGLHMPNQTDLLTAEVLRLPSPSGCRSWMLPPLGYGYYPAFVDWPGSMSISPMVYRAVVRDIITCLAGAGFRKIVLLDTGFDPAGAEIAAREALREHAVRGPDDDRAWAGNCQAVRRRRHPR
ncbi:MAG: creatininase family protein [Thermomicrobiales bacterium]